MKLFFISVKKGFLRNRAKKNSAPKIADKIFLGQINLFDENWLH